MTRMDRRTRRAITRLQSGMDPAVLTHAIGRQNAARTPWYRLPRLTAARVADAFEVPRHLVGTYAGAKQRAQETAAAWMERELHRPSSSLNHRTVRIAGQPYHWRQDYTGQLKLAAGESPW